MKTQIKFQRILFLASLILAAVVLVYGFSYCTESLAYAFQCVSGQWNQPYKYDPIGADALYMFVMGKGEYTGNVWSDGWMGFNNLLVILGIVLVVIAALQFFFGTNSRRNYYITNYISVGVLIVFSIVVAIVTLWGVSHTEALFNAIDWQTYKSVYEGIKAGTMSGGWEYYSDSHAIFIIGYVISILVIVDAVLLALNTVWKVLLMKGEKALLDGSNKVAEEVA